MSMLCLALVLWTDSCKRINLYTPDGGVYLELHLDVDHFLNESCPVNAKNNEAYAKLFYGKIPEMIDVIFYDMETHEQVYETFLPSNGGTIDIPPGTYDVIAYGKGPEYTRISATDNRGVGRAYTEKKSAIVNVDNALQNQTVIYMPDQVYAGRVSGMEIPVRPDDAGLTHVEMDLVSMIQTYSFTAYNISGLENVESFMCYISGQAPDRFLWDQHFTVNPVAIEYAVTPNPATYSATGVFNTFGKLPEYTSTVYLYVQVKSKSGHYFRWAYDVTDQCINPDNTCHTIVVDDPIDIPSGGGSEGGSAGFGPSVVPWKGEIIDIFIN